MWLPDRLDHQSFSHWEAKAVCVAVRLQVAVMDQYVDDRRDALVRLFKGASVHVFQRGSGGRREAALDRRLAEDPTGNLVVETVSDGILQSRVVVQQVFLADGPKHFGLVDAVHVFGADSAVASHIGRMPQACEEALDVLGNADAEPVVDGAGNSLP